MPPFKKFWCNFLLIACALLLPLEVAGYFSPRWIRHLYGPDHEVVVARMKELLEKTYPKGKMPLPPLVGWEPSIGLSYQTGCAGRRVVFSYDAYHVRAYAGYNAQEAQVLLLGDSYTQGAEVSDNETIAANIFRQTGIVSANLGVGGYSPVQAVLRGMQMRPRFPDARVVVLGIMDEDIHRMTNMAFGVSTRLDALYPAAFRMHPYMENGQMRFIDYRAYGSLPQMLEKIDWMMGHDYWSQPEYRFPYSVSFIRALFAPSFRYYLAPGPEKLAYLYNNSYLGDNLLALLSIFTQWADEEHLQPVVFFIPRSLYATQGAQDWIQKYHAKLPRDLSVKIIDTSNMDKERYNLLTNGSCHPSSYGTEHIAEQYSAEITKYIVALKPLLYVWPLSQH